MRGDSGTGGTLLVGLFDFFQDRRCVFKLAAFVE
jgi:hypothetical protein